MIADIHFSLVWSCVFRSLFHWSLVWESPLIFWASSVPCLCTVAQGTFARIFYGPENKPEIWVVAWQAGKQERAAVQVRNPRQLETETLLPWRALMFPVKASSSLDEISPDLWQGNLLYSESTDLNTKLPKQENTFIAIRALMFSQTTGYCSLAYWHVVLVIIFMKSR